METNTVTLPFELYECVVSQVYAFPPSPDKRWRRTLEACALVSKDFKYISYPYLFEAVVFVLVEKLDGEGDRDVRSFPIDVNGWKDRSFYRYVTSTEDIVSYFSGRSTIPSFICRLSLRGDHPQLSDTGIRSFSYEELVHILGPLKRLQHLSLFGVVADANPSNLRPILSSLPKLIIDYGTFAYLKISSTQLYSACALFGDIGHLILSLQLQWVQDSPANGVICISKLSTYTNCDNRQRRSESESLSHSGVSTDAFSSCSSSTPTHYRRSSVTISSACTNRLYFGIPLVG